MYIPITENATVIDFYGNRSLYPLTFKVNVDYFEDAQKGFVYSHAFLVCNQNNPDYEVRQYSMEIQGEKKRLFRNVTFLRTNPLNTREAIQSFVESEWLAMKRKFKGLAKSVESVLSDKCDRSFEEREELLANLAKPYFDKVIILGCVGFVESTEPVFQLKVTNRGHYVVDVEHCSTATDVLPWQFRYDEAPLIIPMVQRMGGKYIQKDIEEIRKYLDAWLIDCYDETASKMDSRDMRMIQWVNERIYDIVTVEDAERELALFAKNNKLYDRLRKAAWQHITEIEKNSFRLTKDDVLPYAKVIIEED